MGGAPHFSIGWAGGAVLVLTSAMVSSLIVRIYDFDRATALGAQYLVWLVGAQTIVAQIRKRQTETFVARTQVARFVWAFVLAFALSTLAVYLMETRSDIGGLTLQALALIFATLPFFVMHYATARSEPTNAILWTCHVVVALGLCSILADLLGVAHYESGGGRFFGVLGDQVAWALTLPLIVYFASNRIPQAAVVALGLALTASRAPALVAIAAVILLMGFGRGRRLIYFAMFTILVLLVVWQAGFFTTLFDRIAGTDFASNDRTTTARLGIRIFTESPVFGSGYNALSHFYPSTVYRLSKGILQSQTSTFVQMLSDGGIVLFLPYLGFVIACTICGVSLMRQTIMYRARGVFNGVIAWLLAMLWVNQSALWFVVGSIISPLVFGMAGVLSGLHFRVQRAGLLRRESDQSRTS
jgi:O-antigen ligase